jgi:hypothetical protein
MKKYTTVFQDVQNTPIVQLKNFSIQELQSKIDEIKRENRQILRALHWLEGIVKLKENGEL